MSRAVMQQALDALSVAMSKNFYGKLMTREELRKTESALIAITREFAQQDEPVAIADGSFNCNAPLGTPLYASPQPAPVAQPLTEDQREAIIGDSDGRWCDGEFRIDGAGLVELLKAIERAHKIGGPL